MFNWIGNLLKKIWEMLGPILAVLAIVCIVFAPYLVGLLGAGTAFAASLPLWLTWIPGLITAAASLGPIACALGGLGLAYVFDGETVTSLVTGIADTVGTAVGTVVGSGIGALSSSSGLSTLLWVGVFGVAAYFLLSGSDKGVPSEERAIQSTAN